MKYFVLVYDRTQRKLLELKEFPEESRAAADNFRLEAEREGRLSGTDRDVVLFQGASVDALKRTHGSYFYSTRELLDQMREELEAV